MNEEKTQIVQSGAAEDQLANAFEGNDFSVGYKKIIAGIFNLMEVAYPSQFISAFKDVSKLKFAMLTWAEQLHPLPAEAITEAIAQLSRTHEFMPSLAEVRQRAIQLALKAPAPGDAFAEACHKVQQQSDSDSPTWSHEAVRRAVIRVGAQVLRNQSTRFDIKREFITAYKDALDDACQESFSNN